MKISLHLKVIIYIFSSIILLSNITQAKNTKNVIIATGGITGVYYPAGGAICRLVNRSRAENNINCYVESTEGSIANLNALADGLFSLAIAQSDWLYHAYKGSGKFSDQKPFDDLRLVATLHTETFTIAVRQSSGINNIDQIVGKRVNLGSPESGTYSTMQVLMDIKGWKKSDFKSISNFNPSEQIENLCSGKIDVMTYIAGNPNGIMQEATKYQGSTCKVKILSIDNKTIEKLTKKFPFYTKAIIPGGLYNNNPKDVKTFGIKASLIATKNTDPKTIESITKAIMENMESFKSLHPVLSNLEESKILPIKNNSNYPVPIHQGTKDYIKTRIDIIGEIKYKKLEYKYQKLQKEYNKLKGKYNKLKKKHKS